MKEQKTVISLDKLIKVNQTVLLAGAIAYGLLYIVSSSVAVGSAIILATLALVPVSTTLKKRGKYEACVYVLTFTQLLLILGFGILSSNLAATLSLVAASLAFTGIYYNTRLFVSQWILATVILGVALFFGESVYGAIGIGNIARGLFGFTFCTLFVYLLVRWGCAYIDSATEKDAESQKLIGKIEQKMESEKKSAELQQSVFTEVGKRSGNLEDTSRSMLDIATALKEASASQALIIEELTQESLSMEKEVMIAQEKAAASRNKAMESVIKLEDNSKLMTAVAEAIKEIERSSNSIIGIIKSIEDIAFQTNLLALNASVEAARAGTAGKGFAIVAEEVRTLANRSSQAASDSESLIDESISSVKRGVALVSEAVTNMGEVIDYSKSSAENAREINMVMEAQVANIENILQQMQHINKDILQTANMAESSTSIAHEVMDEVGYINKAIQEL